MSDNKVLLATTNPAKQERLTWLLEGLPWAPLTLDELGPAGNPPAEEGVSHKENALIKALHWSRSANMLTISSDGGLLIPRLGSGWESLVTHRFAGESADDEARIERLLQLMLPYKGEERGAAWVEALAFADSGMPLASWQVQGAQGVLLDRPNPSQGEPGFWASSLWHFPKLGKTYHELSDDELEGLNDHWSQLKRLVQQFLRERASSVR